MLKVLLVLTVLVALVTSQPNLFPSELSNIPTNYTYPIRSIVLLESAAAPQVQSIRDAQGNIYNCFVTGTPFTLANMTYTPSANRAFLVKMTSELKVTFIKEYTDISTNNCFKMVLDKQEQFIYLEFELLLIVKADVNSGNATIVWNQFEQGITWDIVDNERLIFAHTITPSFITPLFQNVCPGQPSNDYFAVGIVNTTSKSFLTYHCFTNVNRVQSTHISYDNGKVFVFGKFSYELTLFNVVIDGGPGDNTAFFARVDWQTNTTEFATPIGYYAYFTNIQFAKDFSQVTFSLHHNGDGNVLGRVIVGGIYVLKVGLPPGAQNPKLLSISPKLLTGGNGNPVVGTNTYASDTLSVTMYSFSPQENTFYDLALIPVENGAVSSLKRFPTQLSNNDLTPLSVLVSNTPRQVTLILRTTDSFKFGGLTSQAGSQVVFITLELPVAPVPLPEPVLASKFTNIESTFTNLVFNDTNVVVEGNVTLDSGFGVKVILTKDTIIETIDYSLSIDLLEANLNIESYTSSSVPVAYDVYMQSNATTPSGQVVGNGYQITSNARITNAEICINVASSVPLKQVYYTNPVIAVRQSGANRFLVESNLPVMRRGNQFCTRAATAAPVVHPALIGTPNPQSSTVNPPIASAYTVSISMVVVVFISLLLW